MGDHHLDRVRAIALAFPEVTERQSHGAPSFYVRGAAALCRFHDNHGGDGRISLWCAAPPGVQAEMVGSEPSRFFAPPASANGTFSNWLGVHLDGTGDDTVDWAEIEALVGDAYRSVAPPALIEQLTIPSDRVGALEAGTAPGFKFRARFWMHSGQAAWYFVTLPTDVADEIDDLSGPTRRGFGSVRVEATIGTTTWKTSIFSESKVGSYVLPVKKSVRLAETLREGDLTMVVVELIEREAHD